MSATSPVTATAAAGSASPSSVASTTSFESSAKSPGRAVAAAAATATTNNSNSGRHPSAGNIATAQNHQQHTNDSNNNQSAKPAAIPSAAGEAGTSPTPADPSSTDGAGKEQLSSSSVLSSASSTDGADNRAGVKKMMLSFGMAEEQNRRFRRTMEDAHSLLYPFNGDEDSAFFAVFDGHGGDAVARIASERLSELMAGHLRANVVPLEALRKAHLDTDAEILRNPDEYSLIGTTSAVAYVRGKEVFAANVGDARVVLLPKKGAQAIRMTKDHKGSVQDEAERVREGGGIVLGGRVNAILLVTRALGDCGLKRWVIAEPHLARQEVTGEGALLLVACDGVWDVMSDDQACELVSALRDAGKSAQEAAQELVQESLRRVSTDNISVIVVYL